MSYDQLTSKKLFVGGLPNDVTQEMLTKKFKTFGKVASVDIHKKKSLTDDTTNVFAFVSLNATLQNINKCIRTYNDSVWNGKTMKLQIARENFLDRLAAERKDNSIVKEWSLNSNNNNNNNNNNKKTSVTINDKTSNKVLKYVSSEDETDSDEESESGKKDAESSDDDDSSDEEQRGGARMKETNHKSGKPGVDSKADKASKKRKADDDDDDVGDDDDDSDEEMSNKKIKLESQEDMLAEKKKNLEILTSVVGGKRSEKRKLPSTLSSQNSAMQRYDPSKPGHEEFEVEEEEEDGMECEPIAKKAKMEANEDDDDDDSSSDEEEHDDDDVETKEKNDMPTTQSSATSGAKQFAEVSSTVVDAFKKSEEFKLSSLFGNDEDDEEDDDDDHAITQPPAKRPKLMTDMFGWDKEDVGDEESDDNDRSDDEGRMVKKKKKLKVEDADKKAGGKMKKTITGKSGKFFFVANDPRLSEANTFYRTDDLEALRKKWEELRPQYVDSYKLRKRRYRMGKSKM